MCPAPSEQAGSEEPLKSYRTILEQEIRQASEELGRPAKGLFVSGLLAGIGVGVSLFLTAITLTLAENAVPGPATAFLTANAYTVGFIIVILGRTDLFTEYTTLAILPVLTGRAPVRALARLWGLVYAANLLGAAIFAGLVAVVGPALGSIEPRTLGRIAHDLLRHPWWVILLSALLAGWLMGLLSWLVTAGRDTISQIVFVWLITFVIALGHLHHAITGSVDILSALFAGQEVGLADLGYFLLWTTLGNGLGGVIFAVLIRHSLVIRQSNESRGGGHSGGRPRSSEGAGGSAASSP